MNLLSTAGLRVKKKVDANNENGEIIGRELVYRVINSIKLGTIDHPEKKLIINNLQEHGVSKENINVYFLLGKEGEKELKKGCKFETKIQQ